MFYKNKLHNDSYCIVGTIVTCVQAYTCVCVCVCVCAWCVWLHACVKKVTLNLLSNAFMTPQVYGLVRRPIKYVSNELEQLKNKTKLSIFNVSHTHSLTVAYKNLAIAMQPHFFQECIKFCGEKCHSRVYSGLNVYHRSLFTVAIA